MSFATEETAPEIPWRTGVLLNSEWFDEAERVALDPLVWIDAAAALPLAVRHWANPEYVATIDGRVLGKKGWLTPFREKTGYQSITLARQAGGHGATPFHRFLASAYVELPLVGGGYTVNHLDGVKHRNLLANLFPATPEQNQRHARRFGLTSAFTRRLIALGLSDPPQRPSVAAWSTASDAELSWLCALPDTTGPVLAKNRSALLSDLQSDAEADDRLRVVRQRIDAIEASLIGARQRT